MNLSLKPLTFILAFTCLATFSTQAEPAAKKEDKAISKKAGKTTQNASPKKSTESGNYPIYGQLLSLTSKTLTIRGTGDKPERKYAINKDTEILKEGKPAKVEDAKEGQWVGGYVQKSTEGHDRVLKLNLSAKQREDRAPKAISETAAAKTDKAKKQD